MADTLFRAADRAEVMRLAAGELRSAFGATFAILSWDGAIFRQIADGPGDALHSAELEQLDAALSGITTDVIRSGDARFITNAPPANTPEIGLASLAVIPAGAGTQRRGALLLGFMQPKAFSPEERELLVVAGRIVGHAHHVAWMVEARRAQDDTIAYLEEATRLLTQDIDRASLLHALARLALPRIGDYAIVDVIDAQGHWQRAGVAHVDPEMEEVVREYRARNPIQTSDADHPTAVARRTREPLVVTELPPASVDAMARDAEQLRQLRLLNPTGFIVVPLISFGEVLGTMSFALTSTERRYTANDVMLATAIAGRVSTVLHSMSLLDASREARVAAEQASARLREQADELERANESLQDQAVELEQQTEEAQTLSEELEMTVAELQQSEVRFRALVEASAQAVWRCDAAGVVSETSPGWEELTGQHMSSTDMAPHASAVHPDDRARTVTAWQEAMSAGRPFGIEHRIRTADGTYRWFEARAVPMREHAGGMIREWVGMHTDVHERRVTADEQRLLLAIGAMLQANSDPDTMVAEALGSVVRHLGVRQARVSEVDASEGIVTLHRRHVAYADAHDARADEPVVRRIPLAAISTDWERQRSGEPSAVADTMLDSRTAAFYPTIYGPSGARATLSVPLMRAGSWVATLSVASSSTREWTEREVTLLRRVGDKLWPAFEAARAFVELERVSLEAQQRAVESEALSSALARTNTELASNAALLSGVVGSAMDAIVSADDAGRITVFNAAAERIFAVPAYNALGEPIERFILATTGGAPRARTTPQEVVGRRGDGTAFPAEATVSQVGGDAGFVTTVVLRDVTERRALEAQLAQSQKMEAVGRLAGGVAHDFNNILTVIRSCADFMRASLPDDDERRLDADEIVAATDRASALTRQLLTFSRKQVVLPRTLDVNVVLRGLEPMLRRLIGEEIELAVMLQGTRSAVRADLGQLEQVVINLAVNARDAMAAGGLLAIETDVIALAPHELRRHHLATGAGNPLRAGEYVVIRVSDTGTGMEESVLRHVFEPFFTTKPEGHGTGLGLATVHGITVQAGGHIRVKSVVNEGTTFEILLPLLSALDSGEHAPVSLPVRTQASGTILLVEDEAAVRRSVRRILERAGYTILEARHGADALLVWHEHEGKMDLVVTDLRMPELGGRELIAALHEMSPELPVIAMSGYPPEIAADGTPDWMHDSRVQFLSKPFSTEVLLAAVEKAISFRA